MSAELQSRWVSVEEYIACERSADARSEYWDGAIVGMAGGSPVHNRIVRNLARRLGNQLDGTSCEPFASETRVRVPACNVYFYPDITVVCGDAEYEIGEAETLLNPAVIIEVLSRGTEAADRGRKFACYRALTSLRYYVLIEPNAPALDLYIRQDNDAWLLVPIRGLEADLTIAEAGIILPLTEIYERVIFAPQTNIPADDAATA